MSTTKHTAEPWRVAPTAPDTILADVKVGGCYSGHPEDFANAARIVQCVNTCAKFPDPAAALTDLRALIGQARGLLAEGDTDRAEKMLVAMLGVLDGEEG